MAVQNRHAIRRIRTRPCGRRYAVSRLKRSEETTNDDDDDDVAQR